MYPESEATDAIPDHASLLTLNDEMLKDNLESNPWVQGAVVNENWNSGIVTVQVEERRPVLDAEVDGRRFVLRLTARSFRDQGERPREGGVGSRPGRGDLGVREDVAR